jgi:hypothetical protein
MEKVGVKVRYSVDGGFDELDWVERLGVSSRLPVNESSYSEIVNAPLALRSRISSSGIPGPPSARIESLEPYYSSGQLQFLDSWNQEYPELLEQLIHFPLAAHDDGPDALAGAVALIIEYAQKRDKILYPRAR